jgi:hypothetical protein
MAVSDAVHPRIWGTEAEPLSFRVKPKSGPSTRSLRFGTRPELSADDEHGSSSPRAARLQVR